MAEQFLTDDAVDLGAGDVIQTTVLIPDARYQCRYLGYKTLYLFGGRPKVLVEFEIIEGEFSGTRLERWYPVQKLKGRPRSSGGFFAKDRSDLVREFTVVTGEKPQRNDRISFLRFRQKSIEVETKTTQRDGKGIDLPLLCRYSVIGRLVGATEE